jgi:AmmeMemoRadiSam system protein B
MAEAIRPLLRSLEMIPVGSGDEQMYVLRDPEGFGRMVAVPRATALIALLMDGRRTLAEIRDAFHRQVSIRVEIAELKTIVEQLEAAHLMAGPRFERYRQQAISQYLKSLARPAFHAGGGYPDDAEELVEQFDELFAAEDGPGEIERGPHDDGRELQGLISPHIDPYRGGTAYAWAYKQVAEHCQADLFVIFGTAHAGLSQWFSVCRKDFETPLGIVPTDRSYIASIERHLGSSVAGQQVELFGDEIAHRVEHSIEFQAVFLRYVLGDRPFAIVPILVGSFYEFITDGEQPDGAPEVQAFVAALRAAEADRPGRVCYISGADMAHLGQRFGDEDLLGRKRLREQQQDDLRLLKHASAGDARAWFDHVARLGDANRICGLSPTYVLLETIRPSRGELLRYDQAVEPDGTSCVSFASMAFWRP